MRNMLNLGQLIKIYRKTHKLSMAEFAKRCGLSKAYIAILESNKRPDSDKPPVPSLEVIISVSAAMEMQVTDVMDEIGMNIKEKEREIVGTLIAPSSVSKGGEVNLVPFQSIPMTLENANAALAEGRLMILPFRIPKQGDLVYVPMKEYSMSVASTVTEADGGIFKASSEVGGTISFSLYDIDRIVFTSRKKANEAAKRAWA